MQPEPVPEATILHADLDAFYASVEQRDHPELRGRPVIVGGGVVLAASYEAKRRGVRTAMSERAALRLCPDAAVMAPRFDAYSAASRDVFSVFADTSPLVEPLSIDEAFLDVGGLRRIAGEPRVIAERLRAQVAERVGLPISVGVARTKFLAKVASGEAKPDGVVVVPPDGEDAFLLPLPVGRLWGVGPVTADKLRNRGLETVGDVALLDEATLVAILGRGAGHHLHALAHHRDPRHVEVGRRRRSVGSQQALGHRVRTPDELRTIVVGLADRVMPRLRTGDRLARTVVLRLRHDDFTRATRSRTLLVATASTEVIAGTALELLDEAMPRITDRGVTLLGLAVANLVPADAVQMALPFDRLDGRSAPDTTRLDEALDTLADRFGTRVVARAALVTHARSYEQPRLPD